MNKQKSTMASVGYEGSVEIKYLRGNKTIKTVKIRNKGTSILFKFLAKTLMGQYDATGTPRYIMLGNTTMEDGGPVSSVAIPYSGVSMEYQEDGSEGDGLARVIFKFLIPFSTIETGTVIDIIRLYNSTVEWNSHCAYITLLDDEKITSDGKSNILITWTMTISNQIEQAV